MQTLFSNNPNILIWKIEFTLASTTISNGITTGKSSILIKLNELPTSGNCSITPLTGISASTTFSISCSNWIDSDGYVANYAFYGIILMIYIVVIVILEPCDYYCFYFKQII